ncbi:hypothetical protein DERP_006367 [Dermatophagoides pteronyssinus]|uniref:Transmembrane protein n=1 Tax=Dermatophagoides pteronyssinus TaxID=6956 RepID=A0ABQ8IY90_DERPT|nr:hypothetical protein DERP_006367 [Dermatophagoides pteronyssinus]
MQKEKKIQQVNQNRQIMCSATEKKGCMICGALNFFFVLIVTFAVVNQDTYPCQNNNFELSYDHHHHQNLNKAPYPSSNHHQYKIHLKPNRTTEQQQQHCEEKKT